MILISASGIEASLISLFIITACLQSFSHSINQTGQQNNFFPSSSTAFLQSIWEFISSDPLSIYAILRAHFDAI